MARVREKNNREGGWILTDTYSDVDAVHAMIASMVETETTPSSYQVGTYQLRHRLSSQKLREWIDHSEAVISLWEPVTNFLSLECIVANMQLTTLWMEHLHTHNRDACTLDFCVRHLGIEGPHPSMPFCGSMCASIIRPDMARSNAF